jgi:Ni,Fe-hydrogenase III small subunit
MFDKTYAIKGNDLKIDYYIPRCPTNPKDIIKELLEFLNSLF